MRAGELIAERLELVEKLGTGDNSVVWQVRDRQHEGLLRVLKVLDARVTESPRVRRSMMQALQSAHRIEHPQVHRVEESIELGDNRLGLLMPPWPGITLGAHVQRSGPLPLPLLRQVAVDLLSAASAAHRFSVFHQDINPDNVVIDKGGRCHLVNLGMVGADGHRLTGDGGRAGYVAPELYEGAQATARSDLYSIAAVLFLAATGKPAFPGKDNHAILAAQMGGQVPEPEAHRSDLPEPLQVAIRACLEIEPWSRPASAANLANDLVSDRTPDRPETEPRQERHLTPMGVLAPGELTLLIREDPQDHKRRQRLRKRKGPIGPREEAAAERALTAAVYRAARLPPGRALPPEEMRRPEFKLVERVDANTARKLLRAAERAGFVARVTKRHDLTTSATHGGRELGASVALIVVAVVLALGVGEALMTHNPQVALVIGLMSVGLVAQALRLSYLGMEMRKVETAFPRVLMENTELIRIAKALPDSALGKAYKRSLRQVKKAEEVVDLYAKKLDGTQQEKLNHALARLRNRLNGLWPPATALHATLHKAQLKGDLASAESIEARKKGKDKPKGPSDKDLATAREMATEIEKVFSQASGVASEVTHAMRDGDQLSLAVPKLVSELEAQIDTCDKLLKRLGGLGGTSPRPQRASNRNEQLEAMLSRPRS